MRSTDMHGLKVLTLRPASAWHAEILVITDASGKQKFVDIDLAVQGDSQGTPTEGLGEAIHSFFDAASLVARPLEHLPAQGK